MDYIFGLIVWVVLLVLVWGPALYYAFSIVRETIKQGFGILSPENWGWLLVQGSIVAGAVYLFYLKMNGPRVLFMLLTAAYALFVGRAAWPAIFRDYQERDMGTGEAGEENVRRGSRVVDAAALNQRIDGDNKGGKSSSRSTSAGRISIGGVKIPRMLEAQHFLISGTTGAGKTQVINGMLRTIRGRGDRVVIADPAGGFYSRFGQDGDILFNPFDSRTVAWSPFAEIRQDYDCERIAKAIVPDGVGDGAEWHHYAQTLIAKSMLAMHRNGEKSVKRLLYWLTTADQKELGTLLAGTPAAALCAKGNDKMLASTRGIISTYIGIFDYLPDEGTFSVRQWVQDEWRKNWLFITYRDDQMGMLRYLVSTLMEMALVEGLSLSEDQNRGLWYIMDELDSLGKVTSLRAALTKLRKYGGRCVLGLQAMSQLRTTYGKDEAQTLLANTSVKCILRPGEAETAKSLENELGDQEIERLQVNQGTSFGQQGSSLNDSSSVQVVRQSTVMASEIMALPDLSGFLKIPGDEIARIKVEYVAMPETRAAFKG